MPELSVCLTCFNRPDRLPQTLQSIADQTRAPDEVLIWDDHSSVDPAPIVRHFKRRFRCLKYHRNSSNLGMPGNLNAVVREARGDFIANLHDADIYEPTLLQSWEHALVSNRSAGLVFCGLDARSLCPKKGKLWVPDFAEVTSGHEFFDKAYVGQSKSPIWGTVMVRRETYERHWPFDVRFGAWSDVDMWMRVCRTSDICYVARPLIKLFPMSHFRGNLRWDVVHMLLAMHVLNIRRMARSESEREEWLLRQRVHAARHVARLLLGRIARLEIGQLVRGLAMWQSWLSVLAGRADEYEDVVPAPASSQP